jgi:LPS-assembly lipoprotein
VLNEMRTESADRMIRLLSSQYTQALVSIETRKTAEIKVNNP